MSAPRITECWGLQECFSLTPVHLPRLAAVFHKRRTGRRPRSESTHSLRVRFPHDEPRIQPSFNQTAIVQKLFLAKSVLRPYLSKPSARLSCRSMRRVSRRKGITSNHLLSGRKVATQKYSSRAAPLTSTTFSTMYRGTPNQSLKPYHAPSSCELPRL